MDRQDVKIKIKVKEEVDIDSLLGIPRGISRWGLSVILAFIALLAVVASSISFPDNKIFSCNLVTTNTDSIFSYHCVVNIADKDVAYIKSGEKFSLYLSDTCYLNGRQQIVSKIDQKNGFHQIVFNLEIFPYTANLITPIAGKIIVSSQNVSLLSIIISSVSKSIF